MANTPDSNSMWGGRFGGGPAAIMQEINASIPVDKRLWEEDIAASRAHAAMLGAQGIIAAADAATIDRGLAQIAEEFAANGVPVDLALEDIHMTVESRLKELVGEAAGRLHTARSRNDQVATDFRLWVRTACDRIDAGLKALQGALLARADEHAGSIMPGFTHLQVAQPVTLGHHLLAGAAALAGTSFPLDRAATAAALGFDRPMANSIDAVSDRDFALEFCAAASIAAIHLSRLAEEIVIWASQPFGFVSLPDAWSTGSSIMPQKRNPDAAELVRGRAGLLLGAFQRLSVIVKGLPLTYSKDLQDDKETVFGAFDALALSLAAMTGMVDTLAFRTERMRALAASGFSTATDLADWLVREAGVPFREAHHIVGACVKRSEELGVELSALPADEAAAIHAAVTPAALAALTVEASVASRMSYGGTAPERVRQAVAAARAALEI